MVLPNDVPLSKFWMIAVFGQELVDTAFDFSKTFNSLQLTNREYSFLFPVIFSTRSRKF